MSLDWNPNPENRDKTIAVKREVDLDDKEKVQESLEWLVDCTLKFRVVFGPLVKKWSP